MLYRVCRHEVGSADDEGLGLFHEVRDDCANGNLDLFRGDFSHADVVLLAEVLLDVCGEDVSGGTDALLEHEAAEGDDCDFRGAAAYVDDHVADRLLNLQADTEGGCHGLEDQIYVASAGVLGGVADGPDLYFSGA